MSTHGVGALRATLHRSARPREATSRSSFWPRSTTTTSSPTSRATTCAATSAAIALESRRTRGCPLRARHGLPAVERRLSSCACRTTSHFAPGWLDAVVGALQADPDIGMLGLVRRRRPPRPRPAAQGARRARRGRPPRHALLRRHPRPGAARARVRAEGRALRRGLPLPAVPARARLPARLPARAMLAAGAPRSRAARTPAPARGRPAFHPGEREAHAAAASRATASATTCCTTCIACGATELEVLAAQIDFCEAHEVPSATWYTLRCPELPRAALQGGLPVPMPGVTGRCLR